MKRILVTGGAGFIGSTSSATCWPTHPDYEVVNLDALTYAGNLDNLRGLERALPLRPRRHLRPGAIDDRDGRLRRASSTSRPRPTSTAAAGRGRLHPDRRLRRLRAARGRPPSRHRALPAHLHRRGLRPAYGRRPSHEDEAVDAGQPYAASKAGGELVPPATGALTACPC